MKFKVDFANGRCTTISCDSNEEAKKELLSVQKRFNSKISSVNNQPIEKLALGGVLLATILGAILGNQVAKSGVSKTAKTIKSTTKKTISKTKKEIAEFRSASSKSKKYATGGGVDEREKSIQNLLKNEKYPLNTKKLKFLSDKSGYSMGDIEYVFQKMNKDIQHNPEFAKGGGTPRKTKINKKYTHFAVSKETGKIRDAWETLDDIETLKYYANIDLKDNDLNPKDFNIVSNKTLIRRGVDPYDSDNWTKTSEYATGGGVGDKIQIEQVNSATIKSKKHPYTFTFDNAYRKGNVLIQRIGGSTMWNISINGNPMGRVIGATKEIAFKEVENISPKKFATGGGVGSMDKWFVTIDYYEPSAKEDRSGNKLTYSMKTFKVEASSKEEAFAKATDLYNSVKANKSRQIERINAFKLPSYATGGMSGMGMAAASPHLAIADQISQRLPATTAAIDRKFAERVNPTRPSMWEDRGLQKMATGGTIGQEITFKHWTGDIRNGVIKEDLGKGNFEVSSGFGNVLVNAEDFISPAQKMAKGGYTTPSYNIKTTGVYRFTTKDKTYILKSYLFERQNNIEDLIQIQDELRGELGAIIIKNSVWSRLSKGFPVRGISSKGNVTGTLTRIADIIDANKYGKGGSTNERNFVNKSEDYEVRYARKNNPSRVGYKGNKKFELGGGIDLFEDYEQAPPAVTKLMKKYEDAFEDGDYEKLAEAHEAFEKIGYTFDYYLDGVAYDLRPIGTKGKAE